MEIASKSIVYSNNKFSFLPAYDTTINHILNIFSEEAYDEFFGEIFYLN